MSAEHLPGSWTSTANALEGLLFLGKDAVIVVDDFNPTGTANDIARYHATAERIFRAVGNQAGRGRMGKDGSTLRAAKPPRALIVSTGEDIPKGHSLRARMLILETRKEHLRWEMFTAAEAEAQAGTYALALASFIHWLAKDLPGHRARFGAHHLSERAKLQTAHARTADIGGQLLATWKTLLEFAAKTGAVTIEEAALLSERARQGILETLEPQADHQAVADPVERFMTLLGALLSSGRAHVATPQATYPGESWGWREAETASGVYRPQEARLGWLADTELWLEPDTVYAETQRLAVAQGDTLPMSQQSLWQRMAEQGLILQGKEGKKTRNTFKRMVEGSLRRVLIAPSYTLEKVGSVGSNA